MTDPSTPQTRQEGTDGPQSAPQAPPAPREPRDATTTAGGGVAELRDLPPEVRRLVHAVDRLRGDWAEAAPRGQTLSPRQQELWRDVHESCDAVWARHDPTPPAEGDPA